MRIMLRDIMLWCVGSEGNKAEKTPIISVILAKGGDRTAKDLLRAQLFYSLPDGKLL
jgi:hypothetical protein